MNFMQLAVQKFHETFGIKVSNFPMLPDMEERKLRVNLIEEELDELCEAFDTDDIIGVADALGDLLYVVYGAGVTCGIDLAPVFWDIHRSNMTKTGGALNEAGKLIKPKTYSPPDLVPIIRSQSK